MPAQPVKQTSALHVRSSYERQGISLQPTFTHGRVSASLQEEVHLLLPCSNGVRLLSPSVDSKPERTILWSLGTEDDVVSAVALSPDAQRAIVAARSGFVNIINFGQDEPALVRCFRPFDQGVVGLATFDASGGLVALATLDGEVRVYDVDNGYCTHVFRPGENSPLSAIAFHPNPDNMQFYIATENGSTFEFDMASRKRTPKRKAKHHVAAVVSFCFIYDGRWIVTASRDRTICVSKAHDLTRLKLISANEVLSGVCGPPDMNGVHCVTVGERGVLRYWNLEKGTEDKKKSLSVPFTNNSKSEKSSDEEADDEVVDADDVVVVAMTPCDSGLENAFKVTLTLSDQTLLVVSMAADTTPSIANVVCGNLEEVYDVSYLSPGSATDSSGEMVVASNSPTLWIMKPPVEQCENELGNTWTCRAGLRGHKEVILSIDSLTSEKALGSSTVSAYVASSSRDNTARVWRQNRNSGTWSCIGVAKGHAEAVGGVALSPRITKGQFFVVTAAADRTMKLWSLDRAVQNIEKLEKVEGNAKKSSKHGQSSDAIKLKRVNAAISSRGFALSEDHSIELTAKWTVLAHEKDINAVAVSSDGVLIASGSQDKTLKLWNSSKGQLQFTCRGHRRGIWDVNFSNVDKIVATASGDNTVKIWSTQSGACLRSLEGHLSGVLKAVFVTRGTQVASSGADGLLKIWLTSSGECITTIDGHEDRIWALTSIGDGEKLISGSADGRVTVWGDTTLQKLDEAAQKREKQALMTQHVNNAINSKRWSAAARGALKLSMPQKLKSVIESLVMTSQDADADLVSLVRNLHKHESGDPPESEGDDASEGNELLTRLCLYCRDWNATGGARSAAIAARALQAVLRVWTLQELSHRLNADKRSLVEALFAHSTRHYERVAGLARKFLFMEHVLESMKALPDINSSREDIKRKRSESSLPVIGKEPGATAPKRRKRGHAGAATEY